MPFRFVEQPLQSGLYEPEGLYLSLPYTSEGWIVQRWGESAGYYEQFTYNGVPLKGATGVDFLLPPQTHLLAVDQGRVVEISYEQGGFDRYIKVEHRWGESLYAYIEQVSVDSGQFIGRGAQLATVGKALAGISLARFHFAIRISPFNRFDGFGGFTDPLPYLNPSDLPADELPSDLADLAPHPMALENENSRRP